MIGSSTVSETSKDSGVCCSSETQETEQSYTRRDSLNWLKFMTKLSPPHKPEKGKSFILEETPIYVNDNAALSVQEAVTEGSVHPSWEISRKNTPDPFPEINPGDSMEPFPELSTNGGNESRSTQSFDSSHNSPDSGCSLDLKRISLTGAHDEEKTGLGTSRISDSRI